MINAGEFYNSLISNSFIGFIYAYGQYFVICIFILMLFRGYTAYKRKRQQQTKEIKFGTDNFPLQLGVYIHTGKQGSGKTYSMVKQGLMAMKLGIPVYANFTLDGAIRYEHLTELLQAKGAVILCDEIYSQLSARMNSINRVELESFLPQIRKRSCILIATAQDFSQVKKTYREQVRHVYDHKNGKETFFGAFLAYIFGTNLGYEQIYEPQFYGKRNKEYVYKGFFKFDKRIFTYYDTNEVIGQGNTLNDGVEGEKPLLLQTIPEERLHTIRPHCPCCIDKTLQIQSSETKSSYFCRNYVEHALSEYKKELHKDDRYSKVEVYYPTERPKKHKKGLFSFINR